MSISRGQHVCITHRFGHYQLMSQGETDVTERKKEEKALHCVILIMFHHIWCVQVPLQGQLCAGVRCLRAAHLHCPRLHPEPGHPAHHQQHRDTVRSAVNTYHSNKHYVLYDETLFPFPSNNFCLCRRVLSNNFSLCRQISP